MTDRTIPDPGFAGDRGEAAPALAEALASYAAGSGPYVDALAAVCADLPKLERVIVVNGNAPDGAFGCRVVGHHEFFADVEPAVGLPGPEYHTISTLLLTSGTTGPSKAVVVPWAGVFQMWSWVPLDGLLPGEGLFIAMPAKRRKDGSFKDIAHPLNSETREKMERTILAEYERELRKGAPRANGPEAAEAHDE